MARAITEINLSTYEGLCKALIEAFMRLERETNSEKIQCRRMKLTQLRECCRVISLDHDRQLLHDRECRRIELESEDRKAQVDAERDLAIAIRELSDEEQGDYQPFDGD